MLVTITPGKPQILQTEPAPEPRKAPEANPSLVLLGRARDLADFVAEEFDFFKTCLAPVHKKAMRWRRHFHGEYGDEFRKVPGRSDIFVRRTRERVMAAHTRIMRLMRPLSGEPWAIDPSPTPQNPFKTDPFQAAIKMRANTKDHLQNMRHSLVAKDVTFDMCLFGCGISYGPVTVKDPAPAWAKIRGVPFQPVPRPQIQHVPFFELYFNPNVASKDRVPAATWRRVLNKKQLRELALHPDFDPDQIELLIKALPEGNYVQEAWESELQVPIPKEPTWVVFERWGVMPDEKQVEWADEVLTTGFVNSWTCGPFCLALGVDAMYERELPFDWIPFEKRSGSILGSGPAEHIEDNQIMQNALVRGIHDNLADSSQPQIEVDMTQLDPGTTVEWKAGKYWPKRPNELSNGRRAVDFFLPPNNMPNLLQAWSIFESLVPVVTSLPTTENPRSMGSAVRTDGMQAAAYSQADGFISQDVMANIDEYGWTPWLNRLVTWEIAYGEDMAAKGDIQPRAQGVLGAVRREIIAQNSGLIMQMLGNGELSGILNKPGILANLVLGMGLEGEQAVLTPEEAARKATIEAQQKAMAAGMEEMAKQGAAHTIRASTSRADALLTALRTIKNDENPAWGPSFQQVMESQGAMTPALYIALAAWAMKQQANLAALPDPAVVQMWNQVIGSFQPQKPADLDPDFRNQALGMAPPPQNEVSAPQELAPDAQIAPGIGE